jgi:hypothetical protein
VAEFIAMPEAPGYSEHEQHQIERIQLASERSQYTYEHEPKGRTDAIYETTQTLRQIRYPVKMDPQYPAGDKRGDPVLIIRAEAGCDEPVTSVRLPPMPGCVELPGACSVFIKPIKNDDQMI